MCVKWIIMQPFLGDNNLSAMWVTGLCLIKSERNLLVVLVMGIAF